MEFAKGWLTLSRENGLPFPLIFIRSGGSGCHCSFGLGPTYDLSELLGVVVLLILRPACYGEHSARQLPYLSSYVLPADVRGLSFAMKSLPSLLRRTF